MYEAFLESISKSKWQKFQPSRRSGVLVPLFSLYSQNSIGCGEFSDLKLLIDWCQKTKLSIIQLLPLNDTGFNFFPYDAQSTFALDSMYLSLKNIEGVDVKSFSNELEALIKKYPLNTPKVNYEIKSDKLNILWKMFESAERKLPLEFDVFLKENKFWVEDYAMFKVLKEVNQESCWEDWEPEQRNRGKDILNQVKTKYRLSIVFHQWLQWQASLQLEKVKSYAQEKDVLIMGDLPLLVSRDSADVWSYQSYFKLNYAGGAPPDMHFSNGQRWGMPPYNWDAIREHEFDYVKEKLKYAEKFYHLFRIDHAIGLFRIWSIPISEPVETEGVNGKFDPIHEMDWEAQGRELLSLIVDSTEMLPCAEDLGLVPQCSFEVLEEFGIPGMDIQRWKKDWGGSYDFSQSEGYRKNSIATLSNHDLSNLLAWWEYEAGCLDETLIQNICKKRKFDFEEVVFKLFQRESGGHEKLSWNERIISSEKIAVELGVSSLESKELEEVYLSSYQEKQKFLKLLDLKEIITKKDYSDLVKKAIKEIHRADSVFCVLSMLDWLLLDLKYFEGDYWDYRINIPGTIRPDNWSLKLPISLEQLLKLSLNSIIEDVVISADRVAPSSVIDKP